MWKMKKIEKDLKMWLFVFSVYSQYWPLQLFCPRKTLPLPLRALLNLPVLSWGMNFDLAHEIIMLREMTSSVVIGIMGIQSIGINMIQDI